VTFFALEVVIKISLTQVLTLCDHNQESVIVTFCKKLIKDFWLDFRLPIDIVEGLIPCFDASSNFVFHY
jgi:hypothetical protein